MQKFHLKLAACSFLILAGSIARADLNLPISPAAAGSDGVFNPANNNPIDLSQAVTGTWDMVSPDPGKGVYDPDKWIIVFKYSSVNIASGRTVTFINHSSRAPVVWLVAGDTGLDPNAGNVTIAGVVDLNGKNGINVIDAQSSADSGPGGGRGGRPSNILVGLEGSAGFGAGAGRYDLSTNFFHGAGGSYATIAAAAMASLQGRTYGNASVLPLLGGSGGAGGRHTTATNIAGGGGGGGAILIAATSTVTVTGTVRANGGSAYSPHIHGGGGSGGAIRIVADIVSGTGLKQAVGSAGGYFGGVGRIRVEANDASGLTDGTPPIEFGFPADPVIVVPPPASPTLTITEVESQAVPSDPKASLGFPLPPDVTISNPFPISIRIEARDMPLDWVVTLRLVPRHGADLRLPAVMLPGGTEALSVWEVSNVQVSNGFHSLQAHAVAP